MFAGRVSAWVTIAVVSCCGLVVSMQFTLVIPILPDIARIIAVPAEDASWLLTATMLTGAVSTPIVARMADMYGKRRMLLIAMAVMIAGSLICALQDQFTVLLVGRAMQGFASSLIAVGISILRDELPKEHVGTGVALMSATMGIGSGMALPFSGVLYQGLGWQSVFWSSAIAGTVLGIAVVLLIAESSIRTRGRFDILGAVLFSMVLVCVLLPISKGQQWGWDSRPVLGLFVAAPVLFAIWLPVQVRRAHPMVDLRIARQRTVLTTNAASVLVGFAMFTNFVLTAHVLQLPPGTGVGIGLDTFTAGLAMTPMAVTMAVMAPLVGRVLNRMGGRSGLIIGTAIMTTGYVVRYLMGDTVVHVIVGSTVVGLGAAMAFASMPTLIMRAVPVTESASANGLSTLVRNIDAAVASAVVAVVLAGSAAPVDGDLVPTAQGVDTVVVLAAALALVAMILAIAIPRDRRPAALAIRADQLCTTRADRSRM